LVVLGLSRAIDEARRMRIIRCVRIGSEALTHLLFVDDVLVLCFGSKREGQHFKNILSLYIKATCRKINENKSTFYTIVLEGIQDLGSDIGG
jgi:hypothetical protein